MGCFDLWYLDILGPLRPSVRPVDHRYIFLATETESSWSEARSSISASADSIYDFILQNIVLRYGGFYTIRLKLDGETFELLNKMKQGYFQIISDEPNSVFFDTSALVKEIISFVDNSVTSWDETSVCRIVSSRNFELPLVANFFAKKIKKFEILSASNSNKFRLCNTQQMSDLSVSQLRDLFDSFETILTDCDGVLWFNNSPIDGAVDAIKLFRSMGKRIIFITNNSTKHRREYEQKLHNFGFGGTRDDVITPSYMAGIYLKSISFSKSVYVVGSKGITQELNDAGIKYCTEDDTKASVFDNEIGCVVVGFDGAINHSKISRAGGLLYRREKDVIYIATNVDKQFPTKLNEKFCAGTGSIVSAISTTSEREPIIMGKPEKRMFEHLCQLYPDSIKAETTLMMGDRCDTDILMGNNCGLKTLLVGTGCHDIEQVRRLCLEREYDLIPHYYIPSLACLKDLLE